jgi:hypothetical protein
MKQNKNCQISLLSSLFTLELENVLAHIQNRHMIMRQILFVVTQKA